MKLPFISVDALDYLKSNINCLTEFFEDSDSSRLVESLENPVFLNTRYDLPEIILNEDLPPDKASGTDFENVKKIYGALKFLSNSEASEERLWAGLCLGPFWEYTKYRWNITGCSSGKDISQHFFFGYSDRRSFTRNALARLWWIGRLTYDESRADPWELTALVCTYSRYIEDVIGRNYSNNIRILREFLGAIIDAQKNGASFDTEAMREISKYLNMLGGIYILDCVPDNKIYDKIYKKIFELV